MDKIIENIEAGIANGKAKAAANSKLNNGVSLLADAIGNEIDSNLDHLEDNLIEQIKKGKIKLNKNSTIVEPLLNFLKRNAR